MARLCERGALIEGRAHSEQEGGMVRKGARGREGFESVWGGEGGSEGQRAVEGKGALQSPTDVQWWHRGGPDGHLPDVQCRWRLWRDAPGDAPGLPTAEEAPGLWQLLKLLGGERGCSHLCLVCKSDETAIHRERVCCCASHVGLPLLEMGSAHKSSLFREVSLAKGAAR